MKSDLENEVNKKKIKSYNTTTGFEVMTYFDSDKYFTVLVEYRVNGGVAFYGAYAADVNLDSSALKDAAVDCSTTWDGSEFQSPTV